MLWLYNYDAIPLLIIIGYTSFMQTYSRVAAEPRKNISPAVKFLMSVLQQIAIGAALSTTVLYGQQYVMSSDPTKGIEWRQPKSRELAFIELSEPTKLRQQSDTFPRDIFSKVYT